MQDSVHGHVFLVHTGVCKVVYTACILGTHGAVQGSVHGHVFLVHTGLWCVVPGGGFACQVLCCRG